MLIRSTSQKGPRASFGRTIQYLMKESQRQDAPVLALKGWNLLSEENDAEAFTAELEMNYQNHARKRQGGVQLFHEFLSVHPRDRDKITPEQMEDFVRVYLQKRAPKGLGCFRLEWEDNPHAHVLLCGNEFQSAKQLRLSRKEFAQIQQEMDVWQRQHLPELRHSLVYDQPQEQEKEEKATSISDDPAGTQPKAATRT